MKIKEFWELTPNEFLLILEVKKDSRIDHYNDLLYLAWHIEMFARQENLKELKEYLITDKDQKKQTAEEMLLVVKMLNAAYGGDEINGGS